MKPAWILIALVAIACDTTSGKRKSSSLLADPEHAIKDKAGPIAFDSVLYSGIYVMTSEPNTRCRREVVAHGQKFFICERPRVPVTEFNAVDVEGESLCVELKAKLLNGDSALVLVVDDDPIFTQYYHQDETKVCFQTEDTAMRSDGLNNLHVILESEL